MMALINCYNSGKLRSGVPHLTSRFLLFVLNKRKIWCTTSVNKGKIWSLDANTTEKKFPKRKEFYYNVLGSFMPKLA